MKQHSGSQNNKGYEQRILNEILPFFVPKKAPQQVSHSEALCLSRANLLSGVPTDYEAQLLRLQELQV
jgi:hypothetical protein